MEHADFSYAPLALDARDVIDDVVFLQDSSSSELAKQVNSVDIQHVEDLRTTLSSGSHDKHEDDEGEIEVVINVTCPFCLDIPVTPCELHPCGHLMCGNCVKRMQKNDVNATFDCIVCSQKTKYLSFPRVISVAVKDKLSDEQLAQDLDFMTNYASQQAEIGPLSSSSSSSSSSDAFRLPSIEFGQQIIRAMRPRRWWNLRKRKNGSNIRNMHYYPTRRLNAINELYLYACIKEQSGSIRKLKDGYTVSFNDDVKWRNFTTF